MVKERLVLGSAGKKDPRGVTLDVDPRHAPDVVHDLNEAPYPFQDNQFKEIVCHHVLEHLQGIDTVMRELHRICTGEGVIHIEVPHYTSWCANIPEHVLRFGYFGFDGYINNGVNIWLNSERKFKLIKREITFHRLYRTFFLHKLFNCFPLMYERFFAYIFPAEHFKIWLQPIK